MFPVGTTWFKKYCCNFESFLKILDQPCLLDIGQVRICRNKSDLQSLLASPGSERYAPYVTQYIIHGSIIVYNSLLTKKTTIINKYMTRYKNINSVCKKVSYSNGLIEVVFKLLSVTIDYLIFSLFFIIITFIAMKITKF